ncbi:hypothetical protein IF188_16330 [Microbacterium sp. NEAU-LLC]|uniref:Uncharacterized protein n=1 Tax=Microbacterium helvum TaxID=2773713 RepID=A0ABR8NRI6_9MICO|nr:hypothetical protein [Microbacterium helvum]MBD3943261.1 hypothetical protein [Microbacterium helvum]
MVHHFGWTPLDLVGAAFSLPLVSLGIAALIVAGAKTFSRGRGGSPVEATGIAAARYASEQRVAGVVAVAVLVLFAAQDLTLGYVVNLSGTITWWRFAMPLVWTGLGIVVVWAVVLVHGTTRPESPVLSGTRRTWLGFGPRAGLVGAGMALAALVVTTFTAGSASTPDGEGHYVWLVIPVPNEAQIDPIRIVFYGWAYGVPVLLGAAALVLATWAALRGNAVRPYLRPDTVSAEGAARRTLASSIVRLATAGTLLALAGAWRLIGDAGSVGSLTILGVNDDQPYEVAWRHAEFALAARWGAPVLEIAAFVLLLLVALRLLRARRVTPGGDGAVPAPVAAEVVR